MEIIRNLSMGEYFIKKYRNNKRPYSFNAKNPEEFYKWKKEFNDRLIECLSPFPSSVDPQPILLERIDEGKYWREKIIFNSELYMSVVAHVLVPKGIPAGEKRPGILAAHGHGNGKDDLCDINHGEYQKSDTISKLNYDYAKQFVLKGYVVIVPDWRGFGERGKGGGPGKDLCDMLENKALLFGENILTLNLWDAQCSISYLQSRPEVDPERIGCVGLSYGGTMTLFTTILDSRIKCAVVSGYLNKFGSFAISNGHFCGAQLPIGILQHGELDDIACLIAPRPLLIESATNDRVFLIEASRDASKKVKSAYKVINSEKYFDTDEFNGSHEWSGAKAFNWMDQWL